MIRFLLTGVLTLSLTGCTWLTDFFGGTDNSEPPRPLVEFKPKIQVEEIWKVDTGEGSGEQRLSLVPQVKDGKVYVAGRKGKVQAYDLKTGNLIWENETGVSISAGPGITTNQLVIGGRNAEVLSLNLKDGKLAWRTRVSTEVLSVPVSARDIVVVRTIDGKLKGINAVNGKVIWDYTQREPSLTLRGASSPVIAGNVVYSGFDNGKLVALSLFEGKTIWQRTISVPRGRSELERLVDMDATPIVQNEVVYVAAFQGNIAAVSTVDGALLWNRKLSSHKGMVFADKQLFVTDHTSQLWGLYASNGASLWKQDKMQWRSLTRPVVMDGNVVVADYQGYLHWLSRKDGQMLARIQGDSKGYTSAPVVAGDLLVALGKGGELSAYRIKKKK